jgi:DNA modification methylase
MSIFIPMKNGISFDLLEKFLEVKEDIMNNSADLRNRYEYFTKKYRGNRLNDINVGIFDEGSHNFTAQIFIRTKDGYIRNKILFNYKGKLVKDNLNVVLNG